MTSPASETPEPVAMETEAETPAAEPGERQPPAFSFLTPPKKTLNNIDYNQLFSSSLSAEVKPDVAVDDWEAIASDEEKGETL